MLSRFELTTVILFGPGGISKLGEEAIDDANPLYCVRVAISRYDEVNKYYLYKETSKRIIMNMDRVVWVEELTGKLAY